MKVNERRRMLLFGTTAVFLQGCAGNAEDRMRVSLDRFGGRPGADSSTLISAFNRAFSELKSSGIGGQLLVPPGVYDFGSYSGPSNIISAEDLSNVVISAYGATFRVNTTANVIPCLFYFSNPNDITVAGARFNDTGYTPSVNWRGMYCARAEVTRESRGFRMVDCDVNGAVGLFASQSHGTNKFLMKDISLHGTVRNAYYGAGLTYVGDNAQVDLVCENVRRGCIAYGIRNAAINIKMSHAAGALGSNGFISLACEGDNEGNVDNVRINLEVSGAANHTGLVHFYHQQSEALGCIRNIDAVVTIRNLNPGSQTTNMFVFDHELPDMTVAPSTVRSWDQISLHGSVAGNFPGRVIHNPSISRSRGAVYVDTSLAELTSMAELPDYFYVF